jgi:hypothetical protein
MSPAAYRVAFIKQVRERKAAIRAYRDAVLRPLHDANVARHARDANVDRTT